MKIKGRRLFKSIAILTTLCLVTTNVVWGQPTAPFTIEQQQQSLLPNLFPAELKIPETLGTIQSRFDESTPNKPMVVIIQDAHSILDAQNHIQDLIRYLQEKYGINLVALEGGKGMLDPTLFRTFPDEFVKKKIMEGYLKRGELAGSEMAAIFNKEEASYYGIEDWNLYEENYLAYLRAMQKKEDILNQLQQITNKLDERRKQVYSSALNEFHEHLVTFEKGNQYLLELLKYLRPLKGVEEKLPQYPQLEKLLRSFEFEEETSKTQTDMQTSIRQMAEAFKAKYLSRMNIKQEMSFHKNYQDFVTGQIDGADFLKYLIELGESFGIKAKLKPSMLKLLGYGETLATIKGTKLFGELEGFIREVQDGLITKPEEKEIAEKYHQLQLLSDLAVLELTHDQWEEIEALKGRNGEMEKRRDIADSPILPFADSIFQPALEFYRLALERDQAFRRNLVELLKKQKAKSAIVLAGGFHTEGFERNLKEEGISYVIITPKIQSLNGQEAYQEVMQGKLSYKPYLKTTFYDAFAKDATIKLVNEWNEPDFRRNLKIWRDEVIRKLSSEGRITQAGEYLRYLDLLFKIYHEKFGKGNLSPLSREEILKVVDKELNDFRNNTVKDLWQQFQFQIKELTTGLKSLAEKKQLNAENISSLIEQVGQSKPVALQTSAILNLTPGLKADAIVAVTRDIKQLPPETATENITNVTAMTREQLLLNLEDLSQGITMTPEQANAIADSREFQEATRELGLVTGQTPQEVGSIGTRENLANYFTGKGIRATPGQVAQVMKTLMQRGEQTETGLVLPTVEQVRTLGVQSPNQGQTNINPEVRTPVVVGQTQKTNGVAINQDRPAVNGGFTTEINQAVRVETGFLETGVSAKGAEKKDTAPGEVAPTGGLEQAQPPISVGAAPTQNVPTLSLTISNIPFGNTPGAAVTARAEVRAKTNQTQLSREQLVAEGNKLLDDWVLNNLMEDEVLRHDKMRELVEYLSNEVGRDGKPKRDGQGNLIQRKLMEELTGNFGDLNAWPNRPMIKLGGMNGLPTIWILGWRKIVRTVQKANGEIIQKISYDATPIHDHGFSEAAVHVFTGEVAEDKFMVGRDGKVNVGTGSVSAGNTLEVWTPYAHVIRQFEPEEGKKPNVVILEEGDKELEEGEVIIDKKVESVSASVHLYNPALSLMDYFKFENGDLVHKGYWLDDETLAQYIKTFRKEHPWLEGAVRNDAQAFNEAFGVAFSEVFRKGYQENELLRIFNEGLNKANQESRKEPGVLLKAIASSTEPRSSEDEMELARAAIEILREYIEKVVNGEAMNHPLAGFLTFLDAGFNKGVLLEGRSILDAHNLSTRFNTNKDIVKELRRDGEIVTIRLEEGDLEYTVKGHMDGNIISYSQRPVVNLAEKIRQSQEEALDNLRGSRDQLERTPSAETVEAGVGRAETRNLTAGEQQILANTFLSTQGLNRLNWFFADFAANGLKAATTQFTVDITYDAENKRVRLIMEDDGTGFKTLEFLEPAEILSKMLNPDLPVTDALYGAGSLLATVIGEENLGFNRGLLKDFIDAQKEENQNPTAENHNRTITAFSNLFLKRDSSIPFSTKVKTIDDNPANPPLLVDGKPVYLVTDGLETPAGRGYPVAWEFIKDKGGLAEIVRSGPTGTRLEFNIPIDPVSSEKASINLLDFFTEREETVNGMAANTTPSKTVEWNVRLARPAAEAITQAQELALEQLAQSAQEQALTEEQANKGVGRSEARAAGVMNRNNRRAPKVVRDDNTGMVAQDTTLVNVTSEPSVVLTDVPGEVGLGELTTADLAIRNADQDITEQVLAKFIARINQQLKLARAKSGTTSPDTKEKLSITKMRKFLEALNADRGLRDQFLEFYNTLETSLENGTLGKTTGPNNFRKILAVLFNVDVGQSRTFFQILNQLKVEQNIRGRTEVVNTYDARMINNAFAKVLVAYGMEEGGAAYDNQFKELEYFRKAGLARGITGRLNSALGAVKSAKPQGLETVMQARARVFEEQLAAISKEFNIPRMAKLPRRVGILEGEPRTGRKPAGNLPYEEPGDVMFRQDGRFYLAEDYLIIDEFGKEKEQDRAIQNTVGNAIDQSLGIQGWLAWMMNGFQAPWQVRDGKTGKPAYKNYADYRAKTLLSVAGTLSQSGQLTNQLNNLEQQAGVLNVLVESGDIGVANGMRQMEVVGGYLSRLQRTAQTLIAHLEDAYKSGAMSASQVAQTRTLRAQLLAVVNRTNQALDQMNQAHNELNKKMQVFRQKERVAANALAQLQLPEVRDRLRAEGFGKREMKMLAKYYANYSDHEGSKDKLAQLLRIPRADVDTGLTPALQAFQKIRQDIQSRTTGRAEVRTVFEQDQTATTRLGIGIDANATSAKRKTEWYPQVVMPQFGRNYDAADIQFIVFGNFFFEGLPFKGKLKFSPEEEALKNTVFGMAGAIAKAKKEGKNTVEVRGEVVSLEAFQTEYTQASETLQNVVNRQGFKYVQVEPFPGVSIPFIVRPVYFAVRNAREQQRIQDLLDIFLDPVVSAIFKASGSRIINRETEQSFGREKGQEFYGPNGARVALDFKETTTPTGVVATITESQINPDGTESGPTSYAVTPTPEKSVYRTGTFSEAQLKSYQQRPDNAVSVTVLGEGDALSAHTDYVNFIINIGKQGVLVDPSLEALTNLEVLKDLDGKPILTSENIPVIILTHNHADHNGGVIQFILQTFHKNYDAQVKNGEEASRRALKELNKFKLVMPQLVREGLAKIIAASLPDSGLESDKTDLAERKKFADILLSEAIAPAQVYKETIVVEGKDNLGEQISGRQGKVDFHRTDHPIPTYGLVVSSNLGHVGYVGDTKSINDLVTTSRKLFDLVKETGLPAILITENGEPGIHINANWIEGFITGNVTGLDPVVGKQILDLRNQVISDLGVELAQQYFDFLKALATTGQILTVHSRQKGNPLVVKRGANGEPVKDESGKNVEILSELLTIAPRHETQILSSAQKKAAGQIAETQTGALGQLRESAQEQQTTEQKTARAEVREMTGQQKIQAYSFQDLMRLSGLNANGLANSPPEQIEARLLMQGKRQLNQFERELNAARGDIKGILQAKKNVVELVDYIWSAGFENEVLARMSPFIDAEAVDPTNVEALISRIRTAITAGAAQLVTEIDQKLLSAERSIDLERIKTVEQNLDNAIERLKATFKIQMVLTINYPGRDEEEAVFDALQNFSDLISRLEIIHPPDLRPDRGKLGTLSFIGHKISNPSGFQPAIEQIIKRARTLDDPLGTVLTNDPQVSPQLFAAVQFAIGKISDIKDARLQKIAYRALLYVMFRIANEPVERQAAMRTKPELLKNFIEQDAGFKNMVQGFTVGKNGAISLAIAPFIQQFAAIEAVAKAA